ncbi:ABC transporter ATP-binding protein [Ochrobactrum sp. MYb379]|uniref:ABC transporter ATP-binding protein n=1 Tax=Ochrobactrum sp. MYb379 TaxID=2745275 RepID=UPI0030A36874
MRSTDKKTSLLSLSNVNKSFSGKTVLNDVSLILAEGEVIFLLGSSGCGKTTLLRIIAGFEQANQGSMQIRNRMVFGHGSFIPPQGRHLGYVVQDGVLFPHLNVYRNIAYGLGDGTGRSREDRDRIIEVMKLTQISELANYMPHQVSGGQQQRVALARALAPKPEVMLLDEPFSALDEHLRARIRNEVIEILRKSGSAAIIVTHDRKEAFSCADRVGLLQNGRLVQLDTPKEVYNNPTSREAADFIYDEYLLLPARLSKDGSYATCTLVDRVPVQCHEAAANSGKIGQLLIRCNQLQPVAQDDAEALFLATVSQVNYLGASTRLSVSTKRITFCLVLPGEALSYNVGDVIGFKVFGSSNFF